MIKNSLVIVVLSICLIGSAQANPHHENRQKLMDDANSLASEKIALFSAIASSWAPDLLVAVVQDRNGLIKVIGFLNKLPGWDSSVGDPHDWGAYSQNVEKFVKEMNVLAQQPKTIQESARPALKKSNQPFIQLRDVIGTEVVIGQDAHGGYRYEFSESLAYYRELNLLGPPWAGGALSRSLQAKTLEKKLSQKTKKCAELMKKRDQLDAQVNQLESEIKEIKSQLNAE